MAGIDIDQIRIVSEQGQLLRLGGDDVHNNRCGTCGSLLASVVRDDKFVHVTLGTLVNTPSIRPTAHIFVGSKAEWFEITDDLPQHRELD